MKDREEWLASVTTDGADSERERGALLATAAFVRNVLHAIPVSETEEASSREDCLARMQEQRDRRPARAPERAPGPGLLGSCLRVAYTLGKRLFK